MDVRTGKEVAERYNIDLKKLEKEQQALIRQLRFKDAQDFSQVECIAAISNVFFQSNIVSCIVVINSNFEEVEKKYCSEKARFPYIPGFRAYRELPAMMKCLHELENKPEIVFILGQGSYGKNLGIASHFSLISGIPTIGISDELLEGQIEGEDVIVDRKVVARRLKTKEGSKPLYVFPGNLISLKSAVGITKRFIRNPHKLPEPLRLSHKYAKETMRELFL